MQARRAGGVERQLQRLDVRPRSEKYHPEQPRSERVPPRLRGCAFDEQGVRNGRVSGIC
jgi:hypothetical protein